MDTTKVLTMPGGHTVLLDMEDYERIVEFLSDDRADPSKWQATWNSVDNKRKYYASKTIGGRGGKKWKLHRLIFVLRGYDIEDKEIDHRDSDNTLDNRWTNLRIASSSQQKMNTALRSDSTSGYKGVTWHKQNQRWVAQIYANGKHISLGGHETALEAAKAYNKAAIEHFGIYAQLNKLPKPE